MSSKPISGAFLYAVILSEEAVRAQRAASQSKDPVTVSSPHKPSKGFSIQGRTLRMPCDAGYASYVTGILRLRGRFASRAGHSAQDDN